jgi:hypothetical protein
MAGFSLNQKFPGGQDQMRIQAMALATIFAAALLALPAFANRTDSATYFTGEAVTIGQTQLKPGTYSFRVAEGQNEVEILQNGRVIAKAPCHWVKLPAKAQASEVDTDAGRVTEVSFRGNEQAAQID